MSSKKLVSLTAVLICLCLCCLSAGCISETDSSQSSPIGNAAWADNVKTALNDFVMLYGTASENYDEDSYAVFDFDNTTCIYDIQYQTIYYQMETMSYAMDPETYSEILKTVLDEQYYDTVDDIIDAYSVLYEKYGPFSPEGISEDLQNTIKSDPYWQEFASKTGYLFFDADVPGENWLFSCMSGMTAEEIYNLTYASCEKYSSMETQSVTVTGPAELNSRTGQKSHTYTNGLGVTDAVKELWKVLAENGIDVWVCSASEVNQVRAAVDCFGLYPYCTGIVAKTFKFDSDGKMLPEYDDETGIGYLTGENGTWEQSAYYTNASCSGDGKISAILNGISPYYHNKTPIAGFMDSTGDFNFCTEFKSLKLVVCFNRADRGITEGGGLVAAAAMYQQQLGDADLKSVNAAGDTLYVLQGREENGLRDLRNSNSTIRFEDTDEKLFKNENNYRIFRYITENSMSIADIMNTFSLKTGADDPENPLGTAYGFLTEYRGYHSI